MKNVLKTALTMAGLCTLPTYADVMLNYELSGPDMESSNKTISISRFFARIDDPADPDTFLLHQAGKFFPLYKINKSAKTYTLLTPEVNPTLHTEGKPKPKTTQAKPVEETAEKATSGETSAEPATTTDISKPETAESTTATTDTETNKTQPTETETETKKAKDKPKISLRLTKKSKTIAGVHCRMVEERIDDQPVMSHCMADKSRLGITERETRTLARVFEMARQKGYGWLGTATTDEQFVSIASQDLESKKTLQLKSHSTEPLPADHLRVPREFKKVPNK